MCKEQLVYKAANRPLHIHCKVNVAGENARHTQSRDLGLGGEAAVATGGHKRGGVLGTCTSLVFVGWMQCKCGFYVLVPEC